jgi:ABC-2 type transport system permease protein
MEALLAQARMEFVLTLRRGEGVLITLVVPAVLLVFFASLGIAPPDSARPIDFLLPGMLALAVMSTGLVSLGIRTAYERNYGVLKRLGSTPLGRGRLLLAKIISVILVNAIEVALLITIAVIGYGWQPAGSILWAVGALLLGTATFSGLGLLLAGTLRAETTLAAANAMYLLLLLLGGILWPVERLPGFLSLVGLLLPSNALAEALRSSLGPNAEVPLVPLLALAIWFIAVLALASRTFRWE